MKFRAPLAAVALAAGLLAVPTTAQADPILPGFVSNHGTKTIAVDCDNVVRRDGKYYVKPGEKSHSEGCRDVERIYVWKRSDIACSSRFAWQDDRRFTRTGWNRFPDRGFNCRVVPNSSAHARIL